MHLELGQHQQCDPRPPCALRSDHAPVAAITASQRTLCAGLRGSQGQTRHWRTLPAYRRCGCMTKILPPFFQGLGEEVDVVDQNLMPTLWFIAGVGVSSSSACGLPLVCRARKPLPCALRSSATPALAGDAPVLQHHPQGLGLGLCLCLSLQWKQLSLVYFFVPSACACALKLRSLRIHTPHLCRFAVL